MPRAILRTKNEWMVTGDWRRLHYIPTVDPSTSEFWDKATGYPGHIEATSACGLTAQWVVPGVISRMGLDRCAHCCRQVNISRGYGCPINDKTLGNDGGADHV